MKRFEIWLVIGSGGLYPAVVLSSDSACAALDYVTIIPLTTDLASWQLQSHVLISCHGLCEPHRALCEQITTLNKRAFSRRLGYVDEAFDRFAINRAVANHLHLEITPYVKEESIYGVPGDF